MWVLSPGVSLNSNQIPYKLCATVALAFLAAKDTIVGQRGFMAELVLMFLLR